MRVTDFDDIEHASETDVGIRRSHNQDAHVVMAASDGAQWRQRGHVFLVADGMGAHAVGELASKMAVDNIPHIYSKHSQEGASAALRKAFVEANVAIHTRGQQNRDFHGMGTTASALVLRPEGAWVGHVGDSRVYRIRTSVIEQLSFDHSLLWELARRQQKNPEELRGIPPNVIVRSLGPEALVQVDVEGPHPVQPGDAFLVCSDGLTGQVSDRELGAVVTALPPAEAARFLIHLANLQGGPDNITVVVARVPGEAQAAPGDSQADVIFPFGRPAPDWRERVRRLAAQLPWGIVLMVLGIALGAAAAALTYYRVPGAFLAFVFGGLCLLGGLVFLMVQTMRESRQEAEADAHPLQVYRQTACIIDESMYQRLAHAAQTLEGNVQEKGWEMERAAYEQHARQAKEMSGLGQFVDAFAAQCRAMLVLMEAVHQQRGRGESFKPLWDVPRDE